ncbi:Utp22p [Sugiyamaella lignohabitans]|uniref:U3 small nucleolar RNA-associated protein 22 n=1 Tax=Sugiyamaella lignohabitans TaxID=796027 RepID=A0A167DGK8_9ASCO|nr:Utp22p [Sugiyamaella lignohabitans]ANB12893.1 Utp22p [Sugiyamaella lignohabitans]
MAKRKSGDFSKKTNGSVGQAAAVETALPAKKQKVIASLADLSEEEDDFDSDEQDQDDDGEEDEDEDEEMDEDEEDDEEENGDASQTRSKSKQSISAQDVQIARETSELFKSNIFKMQIDELLTELALSEKYTQSLDKFLFQLNHVLQQSSSREQELSLGQAVKLVSSKKLAIPFPDPKPSPDIKYKFKIAHPESINIVGSYSIKTAVTQPEGVSIDLLITMPSSLFQEKDYVNYRYFHKRAFYVAYIASIIRADESLPVNVSYTLQHDDPLKPIIRLTFTDSKLAKRFNINVVFGVAPTTFESRKLSPERNCVRLQQDSTADNNSAKMLPPTPLYNSSLLSDTTYSSYLEFIHRACHQCEAFKDAAKLGRLWLRQRGFDSSPRHGGFGHFEWCLLMAALLQGGDRSGSSKVLMAGYSSYQLFKATLTFLANNDISGRLGLSFSTVKGQNTKLESLKQFVPQSPVPGTAAFLFDRDSKLNVFYKVSAWSYSLLRHEAAVTSDLLSDVVKDRFDAIFLEKLTVPQLRYDAFFTVTFPDFNNTIFSPLNRINYRSYQHFCVEKLAKVLKFGLGSRARQLVFTPLPSLYSTNASSSSWSISKRKGMFEESAIAVGVILDPQECEKLVTHGPPSEDASAAEKFRQFWGKKSELRRFQDGSIMESVVWKHSPTKPVVNSIVEYILYRHFKGSEIENTHDNILKYLPLQPRFPGHKERSVISTQLFQIKYQAFQQTANIIQNLSELPLRIRSVLPASSSLRYTSISEPCAYDFTSDDSIALGIIEFESSSRWPDDVNALEKTKTAFLLKIADQLRKQEKNMVVLVGVESADDFIPNGPDEVGFLQVQTAQGYSFKFRIRNDRDEQLYQRLNEEKHQQNTSVHLYQQKYSEVTTHNRVIHTLSLRYPYYSATARMLKVWFKSHLLASHVRDEVVELLALKPFLDSSPYVPPSSAVTAFYRVLAFLSTWDWREEPLVLDTEKASDASKDDVVATTLSAVEGTAMSLPFYQKISDAFSKHRTQDPALTLAPMFIGTKYDPTGTLWTQQIPRSEVGKIVAARTTALARAVDHMLTSGHVDQSLMFTSSLVDFDILIHIKNPSSAGDVDAGYKNLQLPRPVEDLDELVEKSVNIGLEFYKDLAKKYQDTLILFYSGSPDDKTCEEQIIAGLWKREILQPQKFKVNHNFSTIPTKSNVVELNKDAIIEEIARIGGDLVVKIDV